MRLHPSQVARASGLQHLQAGGGGKVGDIRFLRSNPGNGWLACNGQLVSTPLYPKVRTDSKIYTMPQGPTSTFADADNVAWVDSEKVGEEIFLHLSGANLYKKTAWNGAAALVNSGYNPGGIWGSHKFIGIRNGVALWMAYNNSQSRYELLYTTNSDMSTTTNRQLTASSAQRFDALWLGTHWIFAGQHIEIVQPDANGRPTGVASIATGSDSLYFYKLIKVGSTIYAFRNNDGVPYKSTDNGLTWTICSSWTNPPYGGSSTAMNIWYSERFNCWIGINVNNFIVYKTGTSPEGVWVNTNIAVGQYNIRAQLIDMPDMPALLLGSGTGLALLWFDEGLSTPIVHILGAYPSDVSGTLHSGGMYFMDGMLLWHKQSGRMQKLRSPLESVNLPTIANLANRTAYMRVLA